MLVLSSLTLLERFFLLLREELELVVGVSVNGDIDLHTTLLILLVINSYYLIRVGVVVMALESISSSLSDISIILFRK